MGGLYQESVIDPIWHQLLSDVIYRPAMVSRDGECRETIGTHVVLDGACDQFLVNPVRNLSAAYACAETLWYLSGEKRIKRIAAYAPSYERFASKDGTAHGAYGFRLRRQYGDLVRTAVQMLMDKPLSRQVVLPIFQATDLLVAEGGECPDIPCTICWQFLVRDDKLTMIVFMRSNDLWLGFPYDVYAFTTIQKMVAGRLGIDAGEYHHIVGSSHLYERNRNKAELALKDSINCSVEKPHRYMYDPYDVASALELEQHIREGLQYQRDQFERLPYFLRDMIVCCAHKWTDAFSLDQIKSLRLRKAAERCEAKKN